MSKKFVLCSCPSFMRTWWYAEDRSMALNIWALPSLSRRLWICGIGNMSKRICLFKLRKSTHMRSSPVFLRTKRMGAPYGDTLGLIQPFANISSTCCCTTSNSFAERWYYLCLGVVAFSSTKSIAWSNGQCGPSPGAWKTSWNSSQRAAKRESIFSSPSDSF